MSLHGPAGACIPVASASPIHVFPIQRVLKHCGAHKHIYTHVIQNNLRTPQLVGFACQLGCKNGWFEAAIFLGLKQLNLWELTLCMPNTHICVWVWSRKKKKRCSIAGIKPVTTGSVD